MTWRYQLPVASPVTPSMLVAAMRARADAPALLQQHLAETYRASRVVLTGSGTIALTLALGVRGPRPRVALPAWGCPDLATAAVGAGAMVRLYDLEPATLRPDLASFERAVAGGIDLAVAASFFGLPFDGSVLAPMVAAAGGLLIDDAAQGVGGGFRARPLGTQGDLGVLSFGRGKGRTGGGGGALLANSPAGVAALEGIADRLAPGGRGRRAAAALFVTKLLARPSVYRIPASLPFLRLGETIYHEPPPLAGMPTAVAAALLAGIDATDRETRSRRYRVSQWIGLLQGSPLVGLITPHPDADPGWLRFPVRLVGQLEQGVVAGLRPAGVMPGYPRLLPDWPGFSDRVAAIETGPWPGATALARELITLPTHSGVEARDRAAVGAALGVR